MYRVRRRARGCCLAAAGATALLALAWVGPKIDRDSFWRSWRSEVRVWARRLGVAACGLGLGVLVYVLTLALEIRGGGPWALAAAVLATAIGWRLTRTHATRLAVSLLVVWVATAAVVVALARRQEAHAESLVEEWERRGWSTENHLVPTAPSRIGIRTWIPLGEALGQAEMLAPAAKRAHTIIDSAAASGRSTNLGLEGALAAVDAVTARIDAVIASRERSWRDATPYLHVEIDQWARLQAARSIELTATGEFDRALSGCSTLLASAADQARDTPIAASLANVNPELYSPFTAQTMLEGHAALCFASVMVSSSTPLPDEHRGAVTEAVTSATRYARTWLTERRALDLAVCRDPSRGALHLGTKGPNTPPYWLTDWPVLLRIAATTSCSRILEQWDARSQMLDHDGPPRWYPGVANAADDPDGIIERMRAALAALAHLRVVLAVDLAFHHQRRTGNLPSVDSLGQDWPVDPFTSAALVYEPIDASTFSVRSLGPDALRDDEPPVLLDDRVQRDIGLVVRLESLSNEQLP